MITYGDYFSKKTLHTCGVSPNTAMFDKRENTYTGTQRIEKIRLDMSNIYQTLHRGYMENKSAESSFADMKIESKIVSAFYDSGVLSANERDYFQSQELGVAEREQICVNEANVQAGVDRAQKHEAPTSKMVRDIRQ